MRDYFFQSFFCDCLDVPINSYSTARGSWGPGVAVFIRWAVDDNSRTPHSVQNSKFTSKFYGASKEVLAQVNLFIA